MTITDKEFIKWVWKMSGYKYENHCDECSAKTDGCKGEISDCELTIFPIKLDYNILMPAVENINADTDNTGIEIMSDKHGICVTVPKDTNSFFFYQYNNSMLLALQQALLYIMENEV